MGRIPTKIEGNGSPVKHLWEVHKEIARLDVSGVRPVEISKKLGYSQSWLSTVMCSPVYKKYRDSLSARRDDSAIDIRKKIEEGAETGVMELLKVLKGEGAYSNGAVSPTLKVKVAQDFLDRNGNAKVSRVEQTSTVQILTEDKIRELKEARASKLANLSGLLQITDATLVPA